MEISSLGGFVFVLLLVLIGYLFVETLEDHYWHHKSLIRYKGEGTIERMLHYVLWGLWFNMFFLGCLLLIGKLSFLENQFNSFEPLAKALSFGGSELHVQVFSFAIFYFCLLVGFTYIIACIAKFITIKIKSKSKKHNK